MGCVNAGAGAALAHGSFQADRRAAGLLGTTRAGSRIAPAWTLVSGSPATAWASCTPGLRDPEQDRVRLSICDASRERPSWSRTEATIAKLGAAVKNKERTSPQVQRAGGSHVWWAEGVSGSPSLASLAGDDT